MTKGGDPRDALRPRMTVTIIKTKPSMTKEKEDGNEKMCGKCLKARRKKALRICLHSCKRRL